ncbi:uncharacterized protein LOC133331934, partial [Musca vetustissima]|uniref:uncharacterized protein LOC133331934 n=1 Tax=Musca vetustissima TaxID=27455 RepID=UPI002AB7125A
MRLFAIFVLLWTLVHMGDLKKIAYFTHVECPAPLSDLVYDFSCSLFKNPDGISVLKLTFKLKEDTSNVALHFKVKGKREEQQSEETLLVFDLDVCDAMRASHEHFFLKLVFDELRRVSNLPSECPFKKDTAYNINGFTIDSSAIPSYIPEMSWTLLSHYNVSNKMSATFNAY